MKFLVDGCAGRRLAEWLRNEGHDVLYAGRPTESFACRIRRVVIVVTSGRALRAAVRAGGFSA